GKTTLLRILAGRGAPEDEGAVKRGTNLQEGYFDQHLGEVDVRKTAVDNVRQVRGDLTSEAARQYLARFRFWGDDPLRVVRGFSGGERSRLALAKLLLEPKNLLFLDEPTNHLDIPAAEILEEALVGFEGTVLLVSHDRRFLENVTTRVVSIRDGAADVYPGGFRDWEHAQAKAAAAAKAAKAASAANAKKPPAESARPPGGKEQKAQAVGDEEGKKRFEEQRLAARTLEKKKRRVQELEASIASGEKALDELRVALKASASDDWEKLAKMAQEEQALTKKVDSMLVEWARLSEEVK
ncbi:MAG TPA: ATP-binding cassette domain-containing protein, partial [Polyangiaceae bacterium]